MQAYVATSYADREELSPVLDVIEKCLSDAGYSFVTYVRKQADQKPLKENELMQDAFSQIRKSSLLIAEASHQSIGVGIEVGYAKALNIPIIYIHTSTAKRSKTTAGSVDFEITYGSLENLNEQLAQILGKLPARFS